MSDLFQRLARQVIGPAPPRLRADAALPFAPPPSPDDAPPPPLRDDVAGTAHGRGDPPRPAERRHAPQLPTDERVATDKARAAPTIEHAAAPTAAAATREVPAVAEPAPAAVRNPPLPGEGSTAAPGRVDGQAHRPSVAGLAARLPDARRIDAPDDPGRAGNEAPATNPAVERHPGPRPSALPAALLAPDRPPHPPAGPQSGEPASRQARTPQRRDRFDGASAATRTENEVHVHIGRIEVTAVRDAPATKPRRATGRAPMSLDEYLARRREGT
ncbi:MAG: hypothetical protein KDH15_21845 [Rhodocyclaceae bacterium]|nr:hypothetical protein [Rhodocyclaceae bacterium]